jgi:hypothetical protein
VTNDQIAQIAGKQPLGGSGAGINMGGMATCSWTFSLSPMDGITVELLASAELFDPSQGSSISGLGDGAYWNGTQLAVRIGTRELVVGGIGAANTEAVDIAVAKIALANLPPG